VISTLGAGDSFKAGTIYGLANGFDDDELVRFATATAAYSCSHYPIAENPATIDGVHQIISSQRD
jgi:sugar/nucleoside kinase (ribokinase family)